MFEGAPPTYVVALLVQLVWMPIWIANFAGLRSRHIADFQSSIGFVASVYILAATLELARRASGRIAWGVGIAFVANLVSTGLETYALYLIVRRDGVEGMESTLAVMQWALPIILTVAVIGLAVGAGRRSLAVSVPMVALTCVLIPIPPVLHVLARSDVFFLARFAMDPARVVFSILSVAAIARQCREPRLDHVRAARGMKLLAWSGGAYGGFAVAAAVLGESTVLVQLYLIAIQCVLLVVLALALRAIAAGPRLPRYTVHAAIIGLLFALFVLALPILPLYSLLATGFPWYEPGGLIAPGWWQVVSVPLALLCIVRVLWSYSNDRILVLICGVVAVTAVSWHMFMDIRVAWICTAVTCFALIPALLRAAKKLRADPVKTTADVFA